MISGLCLSAQAQVTVSLGGLGGSPDYRWRDAPGNLFAESFRSTFDYGSGPTVTLTYSQSGDEFTGTLTATGLKPNFAYQLKLEGKPEADWGSTEGDDWSNQQMQNLGRVWDNIGYIVFDYVITDDLGNFSKSLTLNSSYHVLWRTDQRTRQSDDGPVISRDVVVDSGSPAYDTTLATESVGVYGERESGRPAPGSVVLPDGEYRLRVILTEESFHESGLAYGGDWAGAMGHDDIQFTIGDPLPIQLGSFTATSVDANTVRLEWVTLAEVNNFGFEVQKSADGQVQYETISNSFLPGYGTTVEPHAYSYTDTMASGGSWYYRLKQTDLDGEVHYTEGVRVEVLTVLDEEQIPHGFILDQNYPNPFNPVTTLSFSLLSQGRVTLTIYNTAGEKVATLVDEPRAAGDHTVMFDASSVASGVYLYRLTAGSSVSTKKMVVVR
ncbi:MAG: T9SS type A sorting domain-containing protein [Bacteroidota bacterium]